jgi:hypothetical protein
MPTYTKSVDFLAKDSLPLNNAAKYVKGSEIDTEYNNIATADADNMKKSAMGTGVETFLGTPSSANLAAAVTGETGTGALVFANTPTLVTPLLGIPTSGTLTNCTGLPAGSITGLGAGIGTFLATPSSANLAAAVTDETGTGALVLATSPTLVTPVLGVADATSINKLSITAPATSATLAIADGKTLTVSNTMTLTGTDSTSYNLNSIGSAVTLLTAVATTSGTSKDFSIPAGAKEITISFSGVSLSGASDLLVQIGDAGGFETTGYVSASEGGGVSTSTAGFVFRVAAAANVAYGQLFLSLINPTTFQWVSSHTGRIAATACTTGGGDKTLTAELTQVRITTVSGADTFDAGVANVSYKL